MNTRIKTDHAPRRLRWGILGAGHIAHEFADGLKESETGILFAVGSRSQEKAEAFVKEHPGESSILRAYGNYQALLDDKEVDAVYIATPHPMHAEWAIKAAEAGKHILVEKPIGLNAAEAAAMIDVAMENDVFLMEAFMYRCHPQTAKLVELIRDGLIGEVRLIRASFCYDDGNDLTARAFAQELGGGGILDVGCYPVSMARLIAGVQAKQGFCEPIEVKGQAHLGETGVDVWATALLKFPNDILAQVSTAVGLDAENGVYIYGSKGRISISEPWVPSRWSREPLEIVLRVYSENTEQRISVAADKDLYAYEADMVGGHIEQRQAPAMRWDDTLGNIRVLDLWREQVGLVYEMEKPENGLRTLAGRQLSVKPNGIRYETIQGVNKPISTVVLGTHTFHTMPALSVMCDAFFEMGGNAFDTSHAYGGGTCERLLGQWIRNRGIREQVVVLEKGGNYPNDSGAGLLREMEISLKNTGLDYFDIYMIHRDNKKVPIEEWMEALLEGFHKGYMRSFGLSNLFGVSSPQLAALIGC